jgi:hypothetical protein
MFGGSSGLNFTWVWTGSNWIHLATTNSPPSRDSHGLAYDYNLNRLVMFGGESSGNLVDTTLEMIVQ